MHSNAHSPLDVAEGAGAQHATPPRDPVRRPHALLEFMCRLGQAYLAAGEQTALVELFLRRIATAQGARRTRVVAFPTAIFINVASGTEEEHVTLTEGPIQVLRLDQIAEVYTLGEAAQRGEVSPEEGLKRLNETMRSSPRHGTAGTVIGHAILTVGLALVLWPSPKNVASAAVLGTIVGLVKAANRNRPILSAPLAVVSAAIVSMIVFGAMRYGFAASPIYALIPPLVTFLPGAMLTFGMIELAYGDMVSGASRLITGFVQLVLLAFGIAIGAVLVGASPEALLETEADLVAAAWAPWLGAVVFGLGAFLHFSAPRRSLAWMLLCMLAAFGVQRLAGEFGAREISGFFGMLVATPLGYLIQQRFRGPPSMVTFLPSFWLLVPGSLSLMSVAQMLGDRSAGIEGLVSAIFAIASIALGTLVGASLYKWLTETFGLWRLQVGRAGPLFRRARPRQRG
ncbi:MAG TPA: threonine/serine exporter family protein [Phycisphaerales bacterium]|nr:threonine/serine exporter family protein [Phycisphaerales bacterium]HMP38401.1 threonine/serine exporter family protein [Phycisphaerales bacterium]